MVKTKTTTEEVQDISQSAKIGQLEPSDLGYMSQSSFLGGSAAHSNLGHTAAGANLIASGCGLYSATPVVQTSTITLLSSALIEAHKELENISKDAENPAFRKPGTNAVAKYATLAAAMDTIRPTLAKHGLAIIQVTDVQYVPESRVTLITRLIHSSGQFIEGKYPIEPAKKDPQGLGTAITYARRYAVLAITGLAPEDDDGNEASGRKSEQGSNTSPAPPSAPQKDNKPSVNHAPATATSASRPPSAPAAVKEFPPPKPEPIHEVFPTKEEFDAYAKRLKVVIAKGNREVINKYILAKAGVTNSKDITKPAFQRILAELEPLDESQLKQITLGEVA